MRGKQVKETGRRETGEREDERKKQREITRPKEKKKGETAKGKTGGKRMLEKIEERERKWAKERAKKNWRSLLGFPP